MKTSSCMIPEINVVISNNQEFMLTCILSSTFLWDQHKASFLFTLYTGMSYSVLAWLKHRLILNFVTVDFIFLLIFSFNILFEQNASLMANILKKYNYFEGSYLIIISCHWNKIINLVWLCFHYFCVYMNISKEVKIVLPSK